MQTHLAFLRAVNVGPHGALPMAKLRDWLTKLKCQEVRTLLQSGNVVFRSAHVDTGKLESWLEAGAAKTLKIDTQFFVRTPEQWQQVIAKNPFPDEATSDPSHLVVVLLKSTPDARQVAALQAAIKGRELVRSHGPHAYITYPDGIGRSRLTMPIIEKALGTRGTARNWNTVLKMAALAAT